jgi:stage IV sporulation protein FB
MKWSFRLATIAGTEVRVHLTFFLLLLFVAVQGTAGGQGYQGALYAMVLVSTMFFCVLLHEFGHVFAARLYGIRTPDITLLPIGGVARLERMPRTPSHELVVALAGPLVNVIIAAGIAIGLGLSVRLDPNFSFNLKGGFWQHLMTWNILMVVFNMVPAFPMDGGRVLRALLAMVTDYGRATRWAAKIGQGLAALVVVIMLWSGTFQPFLLLIAFFIFVAAGQEASVVTQQEATRSLLVRDAMQTEFHALPPDAELRLAVDHLLAGTQQDFPVLDWQGGMQGMLSRTRLISALAEFGLGHTAQSVMEACGPSVFPVTPLTEAMDLLREKSCPAVAVVDPVSGRLVGLLTGENVGELLMVREALRQVDVASRR